MKFEEFKKQVFSIGFDVRTQFADRSVDAGDTYFEAQNDFSGVVFTKGKFQVLLNGANVLDERLAHSDIAKAEQLAEKRASCWDGSDDTFSDDTFDFSI